MTSQMYSEIVAAYERFREDRRVESLQSLISQARLYVYGFRSIIGPLEVTRSKILEVHTRSQAEDEWYLRQVLDQLDELDMLRQLEVPNDFRAITIHFAFHHKVLHSIKANLERALALSKYGSEEILQNFVQAMRSVTESNGLYLANWKNPQEWSVLYVPDVGLRVVKLIYANRHSINLAIVPNGVNTHKHGNTSEIHFSLEPTDGDQIVGNFRLHVTEPYAVPIKPNEWHTYENNRTPSPHQLLFLTGSLQTLGWGIVNDRTVIESSKLSLTRLAPEEIQKVGGVLLERATREIEGQVSNDALERQLIGPLSTHGVTLSLVAIPDTWTSRSNDVIHVVRKGSGELTVFSNKIRIKEGDAFAIPFGISYQLKNEGREMLILLSSILHPYHV